MRILHLELELEGTQFDDLCDDAIGEIVDVLNDHRITGVGVRLETGESDKAGTYLDDTGEAIDCFVRKIGLETTLD